MGSIVINAMLATIFYLLLARVLGSSEYGLITLSFATVAIMTVVFDFGNDRGMVRFLSLYPSGTEKGQKVLKAVFLSKVVSSLFFIILFTLFSRQIAVLLFNQPAMSEYLPLTAVCFSSQLLFYFAAYYFQAQEKFFLWGCLFVGSNFARLILAVVFAAIGRLDASTALTLFALTPLISVLFAFIKIGTGFLKQPLDKQIFLEIFSFNKWATGFSAVSTISSRVDTYMTSYLSALSDVGVYGLATQATMIMPNLVTALGAVTTPKFSRFKNYKDNQEYLFKSIAFFSAIAIISGVILLPVGYVFMYISGPAYLVGFLPFAILLLSQLIFLAFSPVRDSLLYFYSRPDFFFWLSLFHGALTLLSGFLLIPRLGLLGASLSNLLGQLLLNIATLWFFRKLKLKSH
jgi:O-antigen/teichoic acid export membrane protein